MTKPFCLYGVHQKRRPWAHIVQHYRWTWCGTFIFKLLCHFLPLFCISVFLFLLFVGLHQLLRSLSLSYIHVYCIAPVRRMKRLFRGSLLYPAVNPLPSETLPFPFPDTLTDMHTQTPASAQKTHNNHEHIHLHTPCRPELLIQTSYTSKHECVCV